MQAQDIYAVLGHPIEHSRSPAIHTAFAAATGQALRYGAQLCPLDGFKECLNALIHSPEPLGWPGRLMGCNITLPFKHEAFAFTPHRTERAELAQAANTLKRELLPQGERWVADNTDGAGLVRDIECHAQKPLKGNTVLMVGAGGASAGALGALVAAGPKCLHLANRSPERALALVDRHRDWARAHGVSLHAHSLDDAPTGIDVLINASSSSLSGAALPLPHPVLRQGGLAIDMMYGAAAQPFLRWAQAQGAQARDGLGMLVEQAAEAFTWWRGVRPPSTELLAALRRQAAPADQGA